MPYRRKVMAFLIITMLTTTALPIAAGSGMASGAGTAVSEPSAVAPVQGVLFGAWVRQRNTPTHYDSVLAFEELIGRPLAIDHHYRTWDNPYWGEEALDVAAGRIPLITWSDYGRTPASEIASGVHDALIREKADAIAALGGPVLLRWAQEMAGGAYGSASQYIAAWRRIHGIFQERGATNVEWVWCPTAWSFVNGAAPAFYPGDAYVDWICADGFNWYPAMEPWKSFREIFEDFYAWGSSRGKPLIVAETGSMEDPQDPGRKAAWLDAIVPALKDWPAIKAFVYFHALSPRGYTFWADTSPSALRAFRDIAAAPYMGATPGGGSPPAPSPSPSPGPTPSPGPVPGDCTIAGTAAADVLQGTSGDDVICGADGGDVIIGGGGSDRLLGGAGDDELKGEGGADILNGGGGHDVLGGGAGNDIIYGVYGDDVQRGRRGRDYLGGGDGDDSQNGGRGIDTCDQGAGRGSQRSCERR